VSEVKVMLAPYGLAPRLIDKVVAALYIAACVGLRATSTSETRNI
jgi:hypothetical protein